MTSPTGVTSDLRMPGGRNGILPVMTNVARSTISTSPASSAVTHSSLPSGVAAIRRGRKPATTSRTILPLSAATSCSRSPASDVTKTILPSSETSTPSGSAPVGTSCTIVSRSMSITASEEPSSWET